MWKNTSVKNVWLTYFVELIPTGNKKKIFSHKTPWLRFETFRDEINMQFSSLFRKRMKETELELILTYSSR